MHLLSTSPPPLNSLLLPQPRAPNSEPQMLLLQPGEKQTAAFYFDSIKLAAAAAADVPKTQIDPRGRRRKGGMGVCKSQWIRYAYLDAFRVDMTGSGWLNTQPPSLTTASGCVPQRQREENRKGNYLWRRRQSGLSETPTPPPFVRRRGKQIG